MKITDCKLFEDTNLDLSTFTIKSYPNNKVIAEEGEISTSIGILLSGKVNVKAYTSGGKNFTVNTLTEGQMFGDMLLYSDNNKTYPGSLVSVGDSVILYMDNNRFKSLLHSNQTLCTNFLRLLSNKALSVTMKSKLLSQDSLRDKILFYLTQEKRKQDSNVISLNMTKEDLANLLFTQRPSLSRELKHMKDEGLIDYDRYTITLKK